MGSKIDLESNVGFGSEFSFSLLLTETEPQQIVNSTLGVVPRDLRVLLAEDNPVNVLVAKKNLDRIGCLVTVANDGFETIAAVKAGEFDLILMDIQMPLCDGLTASRVIRKMEGYKATVPIIALTANASRDDEHACLMAGMNGFVSKPFSVERLASVILEVLGERFDAAA
jgi:CheY-like chemotaxis protein